MALLLDVAAEHKPERPFAHAVHAGPGRLRIALSFKAAFSPARVHQDVRTSLHHLADVLRNLGHQVTEQDPSYGRATDAVVPRYLNGIAEDAKRFPQPERLQRRTRGFIRLGSLIPRPLVDRPFATRPAMQRASASCSATTTSSSRRPLPAHR